MWRLVLTILITPIISLASEVSTPIGNLEISKIAGDLDEPWSLGFLPDGFLITERTGHLIYFNSDGERFEINGIPQAQQGGQAGLFDVLVPDDFEQSGTIFLSYANPEARGTAVLAAQLDVKSLALSNQHVIFLMHSPSRSDHHFGGRMVEASPSSLYLTMGERGDRNLAQDADVDNGSIVEIQKDGSSYETISKGHRNPQGAAVDANGVLYATEHGAMGGDELNEINKGQNYGWPVISYGLNYDRSGIGEGSAKSGMEQPLYYWDPSIAPSGLAIHSSQNWPAASGLFFVGSLKFDQIQVLQKGKPYQLVATIMSPETERVRDIREAPDGSIWFLSVVNGAVYRIAPL